MEMCLFSEGETRLQGGVRLPGRFKAWHPSTDPEGVVVEGRA